MLARVGWVVVCALSVALVPIRAAGLPFGDRGHASRLAALPANGSSVLRATSGFAINLERAQSALGAGDRAGAHALLEAALRLAIVLDASAPIPRPTQREGWIGAMLSALGRDAPDQVSALLTAADAPTITRWTTRAEQTQTERPAAYAGATVIDGLGQPIGRVASVSGAGVELALYGRGGRERAPLRVDADTLLFAPETHTHKRLVAAPQLNPRALRVCADPNQLPFSNRRAEGFENELALLIARELHAELEFVWWPERRGFLRRTLLAQRCELVMALPTGDARVLTSQPVYRSAYVLILGPNAPRLTSLDSPELRALRIGVSLISDDGANPPPVAALVQRGIVDNLRGYSALGDYAAPDRAAALLQALQRAEIDVAVAWGPMVAEYAAQTAPELALVPLSSTSAAPGQPLSFEMSLAVRRDSADLLAELNHALIKQRPAIDALLVRRHVPRL